MRLRSSNTYSVQGPDRVGLVPEGPRSGLVPGGRQYKSCPLTPEISFKESRSQILSNSRTKKRRLSADGRPPPSRKKTKLTKSNLRTLEGTIKSSIPISLNEWRNILERPHTPSPEAMDKPTSKSMTSQKSKTTAKSSTDGGLTKDPFGYATRMAVGFGIWRYNFRSPERSETLCQAGMVATAHPSNLQEILDTLNKDRENMPSLDAFRKFSIKAGKIAEGPDEGDMGELFALFLDPSSWDGSCHTHGRIALYASSELLPQPQKLVKPDLGIGIDPTTLTTRQWIAKHIPGYIRNSTFICSNGLVEYKTTEGSIAQARIQNQAAAQLLCHSWLEDHNTLAAIALGTTAQEGAATHPAYTNRETNREDPERELGHASMASAPEAVCGKACVGSICFDGTSIEASVHWLEKTRSSMMRGYDMFSLRVATGTPFAATLEEYQSSYKKFANFFDWLRDKREDRLKQILRVPEIEPPGISLPEPEYDESSESEDDGEAGAGSSTAQQESSASQPMRNMSLQSFDSASADAAAGEGSNQRSRKKARKTTEEIANTLASSARSAAKKLKRGKR